MFKPREIDAALRSARLRHPTTRDVPAATLGTVRGRAVPGPARGRTAPAAPSTASGNRRVQSLPSDPNAPGTGINPWWRYQEENVPGGGHLMVNVGSGNVVLQNDDMSVPHKGIAMAFRRTYNSQSRHDVAADDAAGYSWEPAGMYGNGWTNTFDAHIARNADGSLFSVFDIDGARYDFTSSTPGVMTPAPGNHTTLVSDGACGFMWTKKSGTVYYFYQPAPAAACSGMPANGGLVGGFAGRLYQIIGRNRNTHITFSYSWDNGDSSTTGKISAITATTESGMTATLSFADVSGHRLLQTITFPDGVTNVQYGYDAYGDLISVSHPPNNSAGTRPTQTYGYQRIGTSDFIINYVASPRYEAGCGTPAGCYSDGGGFIFGFNGSAAATSTVAWIQDWGSMNPVIADGTNAGAIQGSAYPTNVYQYNTEYYTTGVTTPTFRDTAGHMTNWVFDGSGRPTQTQECTKSTGQGTQCTGTWLTTNETWDANDNLMSETDARGYETDYAYDANGNTVAVADPQTATSAGTFRPTKLYDYDANNNVVAYCDEKASHAGNGDWTTSGPPTAGGPDSLCATNGSSAHAVFTFTTPSYEPNGELTSIRTPLGYHHTIGYDPGHQAGADYGLPTSVTGDAVTQSDGIRTPFQTMIYDTHGNLICSSADGTDSTTTSIVTYDSLNRVIAVADPDDASMTNGSCSKTPGIAGSAIVTRTTYFPDGQKATTQSPAEAAANVSTQYEYDVDGDVLSEQKHFTVGAGPTTKWYDGMDPLVEVQQPTDPSDFYSFPWRTRYFYDLTQSGTVSVTGTAPFQAYGGLFKTQEQLPAGITTAQWNEAGSQNGSSTGTGNPAWEDTAGTAFDALDRGVAAYRVTGNASMTDTKTYDNPGQLGLLSQSCDANSECQTFTYNERGAKIKTTFSVTSSTTQNFGYDEAGRLVSAANGVGSITDAYDADGRKTSRQEIVGSVTASMNYAYYADGLRKSVDISAGSQNLASILAYTYRNDGPVRRLTVAGSQWFTFTYTGGRRLTTRSDSTGQTANTFTYTGSGSPSYGLVQSLSAPAFNESGMTYNAEGGQLAETTFNAYKGTGWFPDRGPYNVYTSRGELPLSDASPAIFANGMRIQTAQSSSMATFKTASFSFNVYLARTASSETANTCTSSCVQNDSGWTYGYDAGGRQTSAGFASQSSIYTNSKSYDAEDHLIDQVVTIPFHGNDLLQQLGYQWGAFGHPLKVGSTSVTSGMPTDFQYDTLGWDDDTVLFTVNPTGQIDDVKIADFADYVPSASTNALTVWDRDTSGQVHGCHNGSGVASATSGAFQFPMLGCTWNGSNTVSFVGPTLSATNNRAIGHGGMLLIPKDDGFSDGQNTLQGVRTYDPQAGTWTTPDAFRGDVHDPMTQKPYMWNRNNPYSYSDPSGYDPIEREPIDWVCPQCMGIRMWIAAARSDVKTATAANATVFSRMFAAADLVSNIVAPEKIGAEALSKIGIKGVGYVARAFFKAESINKSKQWGASIENAILTDGKITRNSDGFLKMSLDGTLNGTDGRFELGGYVDPNGNWLIEHRAFVTK